MYCKTHCLLIILTVMLIGLFGLLSCSPQPESHALLTQAQQVVDNHPDSALQLIDSIFYPEKSLKEKDYMSYLVTRVQARYKNYTDVSNDTLIFTAYNYFKLNSKNPAQTAIAAFYSGCVYRDQHNFDKAMLFYKDAEIFAGESSDIDLQGLVQYNMADLLADQDLYNEALSHYKKAENLYAQSPEKATEKRARCLSATGRIYLLLGEQDNAFEDFHKGLELARSTNNNELQSLLAQNLSIAYSEVAQYKEGITYLHQSFYLNEDSTALPLYYLNFSKLYAHTGPTDSLSFYIDKLRQTVDGSNDPYFRVSAYNLLALHEKTNENYDIAFDYQQKKIELIEEIGSRRLEKSVYEVQQKYDYVKQQTRYNHLLLQRQSIIIILLSFFLLASLLSVFLLRQVVQQKNKLLSLQGTIQILNKTAKDLQKRKSTVSGHEKQLRETLLWKFNILHKSSILKSELDQIEKMDVKKAIRKFEQIVYGKNSGSQWDSLEETIDELYPGLSHFIKNAYPQFTDTEIKVSLLSISRLPNKEIALLLNQSVYTVSMARTHIRQKMELQEPGADFCLILKQSYEKNRSS